MPFQLCCFCFLLPLQPLLTLDLTSISNLFIGFSSSLTPLVLISQIPPTLTHITCSTPLLPHLFPPQSKLAAIHPLHACSRLIWKIGRVSTRVLAPPPSTNWFLLVLLALGWFWPSVSSDAWLLFPWMRVWVRWLRSVSQWSRLLGFSWFYVFPILRLCSSGFGVVVCCVGVEVCCFVLALVGCCLLAASLVAEMMAAALCCFVLVARVLFVLGLLMFALLGFVCNPYL
ncbi:hypothetical protein ACE6H2_016338 [Prunus campanulata]